MTMPQHTWVYRARLVRVVDGDTVVIERDCGGRIYHETAVRLLGVDAREMHGTDRDPWGLGDQAFTRAWFGAPQDGVDAPWPLVVQTQLDAHDKYGRLLASVWRVSDGALLNADLAAHIALGGPAHGTRP